MSAFGQPAARPIVLSFLAYYLPGYRAGGPLRTISNLVDALGDDFDFRVVTSDRDVGDTAPYPDIDPAAGWTPVGKARVLYLSPGRKGLRDMAMILRETPHDILYLNSIFDPDFSLKPLFARRLRLTPKARGVIAPHGEFSEGALQIKTWKKKPFLRAARGVGLYRDLIWHTSSKYEEADVRREMAGIATDIRIAGNLPDSSAGKLQPMYVHRAAGEPLRICFLSRISPMKNLDFALEVLQNVHFPVRFDIYGPIEDLEYWKRCKTLLRLLPAHVQVASHGSVEHSRVSSVFDRCDLFFLPTRGENYGHVIAEALLAGVPVLISDRTPWRGLAQFGVGWDLSLNHGIGPFVQAISESNIRYCQNGARWRQTTRTFACNIINNPAITEDNRRLFV